MKIPLFSALWYLLRAIENFALAATAVALSAMPRHAGSEAQWRAEAARCLIRARGWLSKWERELRDPIPA